jgi:NADH dehydrogenase FAD-containing subunit
MLYQVATGLLFAAEIAALRSIVSGQRNVEVLQDEVTAIDSAQGLVHLKQHQLRYEFLILATGIQ